MLERLGLRRARSRGSARNINNPSFHFHSISVFQFQGRRAKKSCCDCFVPAGAWGKDAGQHSDKRRCSRRRERKPMHGKTPQTTTFEPSGIVQTFAQTASPQPTRSLEARSYCGCTHARKGPYTCTGDFRHFAIFPFAHPLCSVTSVRPHRGRIFSCIFFHYRSERGGRVSPSLHTTIGQAQGVQRFRGSPGWPRARNIAPASKHATQIL